MFLTHRQWSDYKSNLRAATVPGLLLSLYNTFSAASVLASSLLTIFLQSILVWFPDFIFVLGLSPAPHHKPWKQGKQTEVCTSTLGHWNPKLSHCGINVVQGRDSCV